MTGPVAYSASPADDLKDVGKCAYQAAGAKIVKEGGKSIWGTIKKRKLPRMDDVRDAATGAVVAGVAGTNPYAAGAVIIGCSVFSARPAG